MKKLSNTLIITILTIFILTSCEEEYVPHYTYPIVVNKVVFNEATYVENNGSVVYFNSKEPYDTLVCDVHSTMVFDNLEGTTTKVTYLGGYNSGKYAWYLDDILFALEENGLDHDDTVYYYRPVEVNYAILWIQHGNQIKIDTIQYFDNEFSYCKYELEYMTYPTFTELAIEFLQEHVEDMATKRRYLDKIVDVNSTGSAVFFMDMFSYKETNQDSLKILYCSSAISTLIE